MNLTQCVRGGSQDGKLGWLISFKYDAEVVQQLKQSIPHTDREWRPLDITWWISEAYAPTLADIFSNFEALSSQRPLFEM